MRPVIVEDARRQAPFADLQVTRDLDIGSYIGVPLVLSSGEVYGTLCAIDPEPHHFEPGEIAILVVLARLLASQIDHDRLIEERRRAEAALEESLVQLRAQYREAEEARGEARSILDGVCDAIVLVSSDGRIRSSNQQFADLLGVATRDFAGRHFGDVGDVIARVFAHPEFFRARVEGTAADPSRQFTEELSLRWPRPRTFDLYSAPVRSERGEHLGRLFLFRDITQEREAERSANEVVSLISDEMSSPLTTLGCFADLLLDGELGEPTETQAEALTTMKRSSERLTSLCQNLLKIARARRGGSSRFEGGERAE